MNNWNWMILNEHIVLIFYNTPEIYIVHNLSIHWSHLPIFCPLSCYIHAGWTVIQGKLDYCYTTWMNEVQKAKFIHLNFSFLIFTTLRKVRTYPWVTHYHISSPAIHLSYYSVIFQGWILFWANSTERLLASGLFLERLLNYWKFNLTIILVQQIT